MAKKKVTKKKVTKKKVTKKKVTKEQVNSLEDLIKQKQDLLDGLSEIEARFTAITEKREIFWVEEFFQSHRSDRNKLLSEILNNKVLRQNQDYFFKFINNLIIPERNFFGESGSSESYFKVDSKVLKSMSGAEIKNLDLKFDKLASEMICSSEYCEKLLVQSVNLGISEVLTNRYLLRLLVCKSNKLTFSMLYRVSKQENKAVNNEEILELFKRGNRTGSEIHMGYSVTLASILRNGLDYASLGKELAEDLIVLEDIELKSECGALKSRFSKGFSSIFEKYIGSDYESVLFELFDCLVRPTVWDVLELINSNPNWKQSKVWGYYLPKIACRQKNRARFSDWNSVCELLPDVKNNSEFRFRVIQDKISRQRGGKLSVIYALNSLSEIFSDFEPELYGILEESYSVCSKLIEYLEVKGYELKFESVVDTYVGKIKNE